MLRTTYTLALALAPIGETYRAVVSDLHLGPNGVEQYQLEAKCEP